MLPKATMIIVHTKLREIWIILDLSLVVIKGNTREICAAISLFCLYF